MGVQPGGGGEEVRKARLAPSADAPAEAAYLKALPLAGQRAIVVQANERDVYQGGSAASWSPSGGAASGGVYAAGSANLRFRCACARRQLSCPLVLPHQEVQPVVLM
jgi:hypothetical protein